MTETSVVENVQHDKIITTTTPVGAFIKPSIRKDIQEQKFIDFRALLDKASPDPQIWTIINGESSIAIKNANEKSNNKAITWSEWCRAWMIFMPLVCQSRQDVTLPSKMAYHYEQVQALHDSGLDWLLYDTKFRQLLALPKEIRGDLEWGSLHSESWLKANSSRPQARIPSGNHKGNNLNQEGFVPRGFCINYHLNNRFCSNPKCQFKHLCFKCKKGNHPAARCSFRPFGRFRKPDFPFGRFRKPEFNTRPDTSQTNNRK